jgi:hypothetical protein
MYQVVKGVDINKEMEERIPPEWPPNADALVIIDLEQLLNPPMCLPVVSTHILRERPSKPIPNLEQEDSSELYTLQRIKFGLVDNGTFEVEFPFGS